MRQLDSLPVTSRGTLLSSGFLFLACIATGIHKRQGRLWTWTKHERSPGTSFMKIAFKAWKRTRWAYNRLPDHGAHLVAGPDRTLRGRREYRFFQMLGQTACHCCIQEELGDCGMRVVYRADDACIARWLL
jgi:hypothetical protein